MKRIILEWGLIFSAGMALALLGLWGASRFAGPFSYHCRFPTSRSVQDDLHLLVGSGEFTLCDQFDVDSSGIVRPLIITARDLVPADVMRGDRVGGFTVPGVDVRYYRHAPDGYIIWSTRLSLLIPVAALVLLAFWFRRRLGRLAAKPPRQGQDGRIDRTSDPVGPERS